MAWPIGMVEKRTVPLLFTEVSQVMSLLVASLAYSLTMNMEVLHFSETVVNFYWTTSLSPEAGTIGQEWPQCQ
jgi:hypothetical protein